MKLLTNHSGSYLTGDDIADAVMRYSLALTKTQDVDLVDIPFIAADHAVRRVELMLGWLHHITATSDRGPSDGLVEIDTILSLYAKAHNSGAVRAEPFTDEEIDQESWPVFDGAVGSDRVLATELFTPTEQWTPTEQRHKSGRPLRRKK